MNKLKQIIKQITDNDLNTTPGLTTINYLFELIGLKDKVDLRKFSRNFIKIDELIKNTNNEKEDKIIKNDAFNKNFGTNKGEILEGHRMAQILGVEDFGGDVQISGVKKVGYSYWCTANKEMYKCKVENSLNYIDGAYFDAFSNAALLGKLQNLSTNNYMILFPGCIIWRFGNICGMQLTNVFTSPPDSTWARSSTGGAYNAFTYTKSFEFPSWFKLPSNEVGLSFTSSDRYLMGELMIRPSSLQFFVVNLNSNNTEPLDTQFSLSGTSVWALGN